MFNIQNSYISADHLRTIIFALADGASFEPKGRGYVLKKLVKKVALLSYHLNLSQQDLQAIIEKLIATNSFYYPHLFKKKNLIIDSLKAEINKSQKLINNALNKLDKYYSPNITVKYLFFCYVTNGIPYYLILTYLSKKNYKF